MFIIGKILPIILKIIGSVKKALTILTIALTIAIFTTSYWVKLVQPTEPIFLTTTLLVGTQQATLPEPFSIIIRLRQSK